MIDREASFTSLCYVTDDYDGGVWLHRLADIENGKLYPPFKSGRGDNYFENRDRLYRNDGPSTIGSVGIWDWTAIPNRYNPDIDYVQSYYVQGESAVRVVVVKAESLEDLAKQLKDHTVSSQPYICDTLICYEPKWSRLTGFLCRADEFKITNKIVYVNEDICTLPYYSIHTSDIFNWDDKNLRFLRDLNLGDPAGYFSIGNSQAIIRDLILERITWPLFRDCIGATKAEWRNSKALLEKISTESLYEAVSDKLKQSTEQAKRAVDDFIIRANLMIDAGDIDTDILAKIAMHHDELRSKCEDAISQKWKETHAADLAQADQEIASARQRLNKIEVEITDARANKDSVLAEIETAQNRLNQLLSEIEQYEALGDDILVAVRQKISEAQNDMAGFITDLSVILPQIQSPAERKETNLSWEYKRAPVGMYSEDEVEVSESWNDDYNSISQNIGYSLSVNGDFGSMLSAFLYAAHLNEIPLLIAGPAGREIANIVSVSLYASNAGALHLGNESAHDIAESLAEQEEYVIRVPNMFGKGWSDELPQTFSNLNKHIIWTHPYVEDLAIEPKGLYNYMLPVLSECFVESLPNLEPWPTKRSDTFKSYVSEQKHPLKIAAFKQLKLSKLLINKLTLALSDAKSILNQPTKDKDMEILFGLIPLCVVTGQTNILKEVIETESGISSAVKAEAKRYIEEE